jgi:hypothetical protein
MSFYLSVFKYATYVRCGNFQLQALHNFLKCLGHAWEMEACNVVYDLGAGLTSHTLPSSTGCIASLAPGERVWNIDVFHFRILS